MTKNGDPHRLHKFIQWYLYLISFSTLIIPFSRLQESNLGVTVIVVGNGRGGVKIISNIND